MSITNADIESFGKVLTAIGGKFIALGENIQDQPNLLQRFLGIDSEKTVENTSHDLKENVDIENLPLYEIAKTKKENEMRELLAGYKVEQLQYLIGHFSLGAIKKRNKDAIVSYIVEQVKKRTTDVFIDHK